MAQVSAILLGAGASRRMGVDKLSLPWKKHTVLEECVKNLLGSQVKEVVVVLSPRAMKMRDRLKGERVKVALNPDSRKGMSSSIAKGLLSIDPGSQGILIAFGDQPLLKPRTVNALIHAFVPGKEDIVLPFYRGQKGHPVLFDKSYRKQLLSLTGDVGGKSIVENHSDRVVKVRVRSKAVVSDIDTWKDYQDNLRWKS